MRNRLMIAMVTAMALPLLAADPSASIAQARQSLQAKDYDRAIQLLQNAIPDAAVLSEPERRHAIAAIHFYTAVAFDGMSDAARTREELERFFQFSPNTNQIDPTKFESRFVSQFNEVYTSLRQEESSNFESVYPGYRTFSSETPRARPIATWGDGPELALLATAEERTAWRRLQDDEERHSFVAEFWRRRDTTPETPENETRDQFLHRVTFADHAFATEGPRGSVTDRGRVFVLLGPPRAIRQKPLTERDGGANRVRGTVDAGSTGGSVAGFRAMEISNRNMTRQSSVPLAKGKVERWIYDRSQLPRTIPDAEVVFKFITQEGYGNNVLQREFFVNKVLHDAVARH